MAAYTRIVILEALYSGVEAGRGEVGWIELLLKSQRDIINKMLS
jgi:hypothetical protein